MTQSTEKAIAKVEAIKTGYAQKTKGTFITFLLNEGPDDDYQGLTDLALGQVVTLMVVQKDVGA